MIIQVCTPVNSVHDYHVYMYIDSSTLLYICLIHFSEQVSSPMDVEVVTDTSQSQARSPIDEIGLAKIPVLLQQYGAPTIAFSWVMILISPALLVDISN